MLPDLLGRPLRNLRLSVTDRCNLRCAYCMPEEEYVWLPREDILSFEEIAQLVDVFADLGVDKVRLTGGEPLLRKDLDRLVTMLAGNRRIHDLALTTNGVLLAEQAGALRAAGLHRATVSLDTLRPERFKALTRRDAHARVLEGIEAVRRSGWPGLKIDTVVIRGVNDDELVDLIEYGRGAGAEVRFIEYMDVGGATGWSMDQVVSRRDMLAILERRYGRIEPIVEDSSAPADRFRLPDGAVFGIISSTTQPFCQTCDRSRLRGYPPRVCISRWGSRLSSPIWMRGRRSVRARRRSAPRSARARHWELISSMSSARSAPRRNAAARSVPRVA